MMNHSNRPLGRTQTVRLMVALTILAWATQTLFKQWGMGAEIAEVSPATQPAEPVESFVPAISHSLSGTTLELRADATVIGGEVKLRQVCRWADQDKATFDPIGDLVLARLASRAPFKSVSVEEIRGILRDAGVNIGVINFAGATSCAVARSDVEYDEKNALQQWIEAREGASTKPASEVAIATQPAPTTAPADESPVKTLRDALSADLATRLQLAPESLQINFKPSDEKVLSLSSPLFRYDIEPLRAKTLGQVMWNVAIISGSGSRKVTIVAEARAWQNQVVTVRPVAYRQIIRPEDVVARRTLADQLSDDPLLSMEQIVAQQAARELKPGMVMTARMIDPIQLVKTGQFVTVTLEQGSVRIKTVARAMESGSFGQTIRVKNEATREVFQVVLTGPQTGTMNLSAPVASVESQN